LGSRVDDLILKNCTINLQALDAFVQISNILYQRAFARVLRQTLSDRFQDRNTTPMEQSALSGERYTPPKELDPNILQYRWVAGYNGLWGKAMKPS
jgi:hypothetical protein